MSMSNSWQRSVESLLLELENLSYLPTSIEIQVEFYS
jgi:hypothetical protein